MDHLVFASADLDHGVRYVEARLGVETSPGGRHLGFGTRNRLVGLGPQSYLEIVGVDPEQTDPERPRWFGLDGVGAPHLATWCARSPDLEAATARGRAAGVDLGEALEGSRLREDGSPLTWTMTDPWAERAGGVVPFLIDWGESVHPGGLLPSSCTLAALRLEHPDPVSVRRWLEALGVDVAHGASAVPAPGSSAVSVEIDAGRSPRLVALLETPSGVVELS